MSVLNGIRVVDFTRMLAGPWCTEVLADLGADVVKIEEPKIGDPTRRHRPLVGSESSYYMAVNRGKRSFAVDLNTPDGKPPVIELVREADILVENFRPGVMERLGFAYHQVKEYNPGIVYCSLSGFGETGPMRDRISFDIVNQALAGLLDVTGHPDEDPVRCGVPVGDIVGGMYMAISVLAGLANRRSARLGCRVELSLHDAVLWLLSGVSQTYLTDGTRPTRRGNDDHAVAPYGAYRAVDGWLVAAGFLDDDWRRLCDALEVPGLVDDPRFADPDGRHRHKAVLDELITPWIARRTTAECLSALGGAGVSAARVLSLREALDAAAAADDGFVYTAHSRSAGDVRMLASPLVIDGERLGVGTQSPLLGGQTRSVLSELGYDDEAIGELIANGTVTET